jgi:hypothetical protein
MEPAQAENRRAAAAASEPHTPAAVTAYHIGSLVLQHLQ